MRRAWGPLLLVLTAMVLGACGRARHVEHGGASWYGPGFRGEPTASGETFRPRRRTAAHRTLPFGTVLRVTDTQTGDRVRVVVTDRGPFVDGRIVDLSRGAARRLGTIDRGVVDVKIEVVGCRRRRFSGPRSCRGTTGPR